MVTMMSIFEEWSCQGEAVVISHLGSVDRLSDFQPKKASLNNCHVLCKWRWCSGDPSEPETGLCRPHGSTVQERLLSEEAAKDDSPVHCGTRSFSTLWSAVEAASVTSNTKTKSSRELAPSQEHS